MLAARQPGAAAELAPSQLTMPRGPPLVNPETTGVYLYGRRHDVDDNMRSVSFLTNDELRAAVNRQEEEISITRMHLVRMEQHRIELGHELYDRVNRGVAGPLCHVQ